MFPIEIRPWTKLLPERRSWIWGAATALLAFITFLSIDDVVESVGSSPLTFALELGSTTSLGALTTCMAMNAGLVSFRRRRHRVHDGKVEISYTPVVVMHLLISYFIGFFAFGLLTSLYSADAAAHYDDLRFPDRAIGGLVALAGLCFFAYLFPRRGRLVIGPEAIESRSPFNRCVIPWADITRLTVHTDPSRPASTDDWKRFGFGIRFEVAPDSQGEFPELTPTRSGARVTAIGIAGLDYDPNTLANAIRALYEQPELRYKLPDIAPILLAGPSDGELRRMVIGDTWLRPHERAARQWTELRDREGLDDGTYGHSLPR